MFPLLTLATEIVLAIVESIDEESDLISLAQTCTRLQPLAEARVFNKVCARNGKHAQGLAKALCAQPERFKYVQTLEATPVASGYDGIKIMPSLVCKMIKLRELKVESPLINTARYARWWVEESEAAYLEMFREANAVIGDETPLTCLRSFTLHSHGVDQRFTDIKTLLPIFLSPTLSFIHVSCVGVSGSLTLPSDEVLTPLKTLIFEECPIAPGTLKTLLGLPRALESLSLREVTYHYSPYETINVNIVGTLDALRRQKDFLKYLQHDCRLPVKSKKVATIATSHGLSDFTALETLELSRSSVLNQLLEGPGFAPPSLKTYRLTGMDFESDEDLIVGLKQLPYRKLQIELHQRPETSLNMWEGNFMTSQFVQKLVGIARMLRERDSSINLIVLQKRGGYIPPYLYNEPVPRRHVSFESDKFWDLEKIYLKEKEDDEKMNEKRAIKRVSVEDNGTIIAAKMMAGYKEIDDYSSPESFAQGSDDA